MLYSTRPRVVWNCVSFVVHFSLIWLSLFTPMMARTLKVFQFESLAGNFTTEYVSSSKSAKTSGTMAAYGGPLYDVILFVAICPTHHRMLLREFHHKKGSNLYYLPFFPLKLSKFNSMRILLKSIIWIEFNRSDYLNLLQMTRGNTKFDTAANSCSQVLVSRPRNSPSPLRCFNSIRFVYRSISIIFTSWLWTFKWMIVLVRAMMTKMTSRLWSLHWALTSGSL